MLHILGSTCIFINSRILTSLNYLCQLLFLIGVFTPSDDLAKEIFEASEASGEKPWRLPLEESYWESMKSGVADMVNTGAGPGGAITAALFLKQVSEMVIYLLFFS